MNEKGLYSGAFYFPNSTRYIDYNKDNADNILSTLDVIHYILCCFDHVEDIKREFAKIDIIKPDLKSCIPSCANALPDLYLFVVDKTGKSIVIESYLKCGKTMIYDNHYGVITNNPDFDFYATNIKNYLHVTRYDRFLELDGESMQGLGGRNFGFTRWLHSSCPFYSYLLSKSERLSTRKPRRKH